MELTKRHLFLKIKIFEERNESLSKLFCLGFFRCLNFYVYYVSRKQQMVDIISLIRIRLEKVFFEKEVFFSKRYFSFTAAESYMLNSRNSHVYRILLTIKSFIIVNNFIVTALLGISPIEYVT